MLALPDPYDPNANAPYRFHDMSLYAGRYYMYFGPTAALPNVAWRWLTGQRPWAALIQALLAVAMFGCALAILRGVAERTSSSAPGWLPAAIALGVALGGTMPYLIGRPGLYSQPVLMAAACCVAGWMLIVRGAGPGAWGVLC